VTKYAGLIGHGIAHSISPAFQQAAFDRYGLDIRYELWDTAPAKLADAVGRVRQPETVGANVTVPHKESAIALVDEHDDLVREIGALNTVVNRGGRLIGYNTDAGGFLTALRQEGGFDPAGSSAVMLGAGGVARAAGFALVRAGVKSLVLTDIIMERAMELASELKGSQARNQGPPPRSCIDAPDVGGIASLGAGASQPVEVRALSAEDARFAEVVTGCDLLVNCTPVGMRHSATEGQSPLEARLIPGRALVYDVVYNPVETELIKQARDAGARTLNGLAMLVYQGAASFELWTGRAAPLDIMMEAASKALE